MPHARFSTPSDQRWLSDYTAGATYELGAFTLSEQEIIEFAQRFDPQYFHVDAQAARHSPYGGLIASGWHTASAAMRLMVDGFISHNAGMGSPGLEDIRWLRPVRPGDRLTVEVTVLETRVSQSKPDRGLLRHELRALDATGEVVMSFRGTGFVRVRPGQEGTR